MATEIATEIAATEIAENNPARFPDRHALSNACTAASEMVKRFAERSPVTYSQILERLETSTENRANAVKTYNEYLNQLSSLVAEVDEKTLAKRLREFRLQSHVELACRDIAGQITIQAMLRALSDLATVCLEVTYQYLYRQMCERYGIPMGKNSQTPQHLTVFGMGKLGGGELNFSSDIDLILAYPENGTTTSDENPIDNELFFHRLAQKLIRLLDQYDENGFVYRVDMRLKPFGSVGTLATTFTAMTRYYLQHGRDWERYALVKMRPVAGDIAAGQALISQLSSFVYQRHVDYVAMHSIDDMKSKIIAAAKEKGIKDNLKLGYGGIREIEFIVQTFQMIYGGRMQSLRQQSLLGALQALQDKELLSEKVAAMLRVNYLRLRQIENAIQYYQDQQTHDLPNKTAPRQALLTALGEKDWLRLVEEINRIRYEVFALFQRVFATQDGQAQPIDQEKLTDDYWLDLLYQTDMTQQSAETIAHQFVQFYKRMWQHDLGEKYLIRLNWVLPQIIAALDGEDNPVKIANHMLTLLESIADESVYLSLLVEHPGVLKKIMHLFMHSRWMTEFLCTHPLVIDELIHENHETAPRSAQNIRRELQRAIAQCSDTESTLQKLMDFKNAETFRVASADLQGNIKLLHVSDQLSWIAEAIIDAILTMAIDALVEKYGRPIYVLDGQTKQASFGIIAYGKLGSLEMGYRSDLDLVFLHDSQGEKQMTNGERSIDNAVFFSHVVKKFTDLITTLTPSGQLYPVDTRLRPSGGSGQAVNSVNAFAQYQFHDAWTWEHQALVRARFVAGGQSIADAFADIRQRVLAMPRDSETLRQDVLKMRTKMRDQHRDKTLPDGQANIKQAAGGLTDIEFIVQYLLLKHAVDFPDLVRCSDNVRQIAALELFEILRSADAADLRFAYRAYRFWIHHQQLLGHETVVDTARFAQEMQDVKAIWAQVFETQVETKAETKTEAKIGAKTS
ncbi:bifunctional [glutamate--ammonia ligase]-adenylyl-L-tyrosine phosphorylase/[glutamate--ammonia-ligase] adenylyltransferase [Ostreibacterium oceani]|uniref:Bifunctional glutamine synthetase adenylyltransferase/adenylyl-removing enzyme n=1 Tax=Ostreibacterium oceani TaxID=2654998 RepID=A0A6N7EXS1_9GAMM|nr:bifunctional [glutamate--ammonia ligase]-adenylyl-L-tyrosine phosphorylase/[glutamate--ammonia-ligase] adenylyltransferase [Ostreibacterium oceani]MPV85268.1 bifunctional [glutamate--ammonia ligase]-adenylyl-L-tyrosine phosphorylase/[glutamate--ammonia-ligase] adenylyltransferase [Ostreibacterium oceani]